MVRGILAAVALAAVGGHVMPRVQIVDGHHRFSGGTMVRVLGACSYSTDSIDCWDLHGIRDAALTSRVCELYKRPQSQMALVVGKKNRLVVTEWWVGPHGGPFFAKSNESEFRMDPTPGWQLYTGSATFALSQEVGDFGVTVTENDSAHARELPICKNATVKVGDRTATYRAMSPIPLSSEPWAAQERDWSKPLEWCHVVEWTGQGDPGCVVAILNRDRKYTYAFDREGKPVSLEIIGPWLKQAYDGTLLQDPKGVEYFFAMQRATMATPTVQSISTNVDPKYAAYIQFTPSTTIQATIIGVPLDPATL